MCIPKQTCCSCAGLYVLCLLMNVTGCEFYAAELSVSSWRNQRCFPLHLLLPAWSSRGGHVQNDASWVWACSFRLAQHNSYLIQSDYRIYCLPVCGFEYRASKFCVCARAHKVFSYTAINTDTVTLPWKANNWLLIQVKGANEIYNEQHFKHFWARDMLLYQNIQQVRPTKTGSMECEWCTLEDV